MSNSELPGLSGDDAATPASKGRTRRSLLGLGGVIAGAVIGTAVLGTRANAGPPVCFLRGTMIRTPGGDRAIETLAIGDKVLAVSGTARPVKWVGRMTFAKSAGRAEWVRDILPVRLARGSINGDLPRRDLYVSQKHALYLDGVLVTAGSLVGAGAITIAAPADTARLEYFHIELDSHDAVYAEGLPAETFREAGGNRESFDNFVEYERIHGKATREVAAFAPMAGFTGTRDRARSYIRSALSPFIDRRTSLDRIRDRVTERVQH